MSQYFASLKESISKIEKTYHPEDRVTLPTEKLANQNQPFHFFCRFAPKYKKYWGNASVPSSLKKQEQFEAKIMNHD